MERRNEDNAIPLLELILFFTLKFPIGVINENKNPRASVVYRHQKMLRNWFSLSDLHIVLQYKQFFPLVLHDILNKILEEIGDVWLASIT